MKGAGPLLGIQRIASVAEIVGFNEGELRETAEFIHRDVTEQIAYSPTGKKPRPVIKVSGRLRTFQERFYRRRLVERIQPSPCSFGGIRGRSPLQNARVHRKNRCVYKADISNFFPGISIDRVNRLFLETLGCSPSVSNILTRLCTYNYHLALGLVTSPILAEAILTRVDSRIARLCEHYGARYSRFVDDITISAQYDLARVPIPRKVHEILRDHGLRPNPEKDAFGTTDDGVEVTGVLLRRGRADVRKGFLHELKRQIRDHASLASDGEFDGPYQSESQLLGRVWHAIWIRPTRKQELLKLFGQVNWHRVREVAAQRELVVARPVLLPADAPPPDFSACYGNGVTG